MILYHIFGDLKTSMDEGSEALCRGDNLVLARPQEVQLEQQQGRRRRQGREGEEGREEGQGGQHGHSSVFLP